MTPDGLVWSRGAVVAAEEAVVPALDRGFLLGDGLFETMRARGARVFRIDRHLDRLAGGAARVGIAVPPGVRDAVEELLRAAAGADARSDRGRHDGRRALAAEARAREWAVRITLTRGKSGGGLDPGPTSEPTLSVWARPIAAELDDARQEGLALRTATHRLCARSALAGLKSLAYLANVCALAEARAAGADDALLLDERDHVAEATASNLFWVNERGEVRTPSVGCGILPGLTRADVLQLAREHEIEATEGEWPLEDLARAREAFTTSTLRGVAPVVSLDGEAIGDAAPGPLTRALQRAWGELVSRQTAEGS